MIECLCCGRETIEERYAYDVCTYCGWEDDPIQGDEEDYWGGANKLSLKECKELVRNGKNAVDGGKLPYIED